MTLFQSSLVILCAFLAGTALGVIIGGLCAVSALSDQQMLDAHKFE
ncbi:hypothetical protein B0G76_2877 [Paraburkholderia sp. BL23I1N1]|nr:hypothetical protein B0G76_2877 [Paraburkholderia sp. BL23I1N1]